MNDRDRRYFEAIVRTRLILRGWTSLESLSPTARKIAEELGPGRSAGILGALQAELADALAPALVEVDRLLASGEIPTGGALRRLIAEISIAFAAASGRVEAITQTAVDRVFAEVHKAHDAGLAAIAAGAAFVAVSASLADSIARSKARREKFRAPSPAQGIRSTFVSFNGAVDRFIRANVGLPRREAALRVLSSFDRYPNVHRALSQLGPRGEAVRRSVVRAGRAQTTLDDPARGLYANARRVLIHQINVAFHEGDALAAALSPAVDLVQWHVSDAHSVIDICDILKDADVHGFGPGVYYPETAPSLPHPHCQDYITPITRPRKDWDKPKRTPKIPRKIDRKEAARLMELAGDTREMTGKRLSGLTGGINRSLQVADDSWRAY